MLDSYDDYRCTQCNREYVRREVQTQRAQSVKRRKRKGDASEEEVNGVFVLLRKGFSIDRISYETWLPRYIIERIKAEAPEGIEPMPRGTNWTPEMINELRVLMVQGKTGAQIAAEMRVPYGTVGSHMARFRKELRKQEEERMAEPETAEQVEETSYSIKLSEEQADALRDILIDRVSEIERLHDSAVKDVEEAQARVQQYKDELESTGALMEMLNISE